MTVQEILKDNGGFLRAKELTSRTSWYQLQKMQDDGSLVKLKRGLYRAESDSIQQHVEIAAMIPVGIFCMYTTWNYYQLSTNNPFAFHVAIPKKAKITLPDYPPVKLYYWSDKSYLLGQIEVKEENQIIRMYDLEKSVCDAVRLRNKIGIDTMSEILKNYLKRNDRNLDKLVKYARQLRIENYIKQLMTVML